MILAIIGSVSLHGNPEAQRAIEDVLDRYKPDEVVSGGAKGIDRMAVREARRRRIPTGEFTPHERRWDGDKGFRARNLKIAQICDALVRIVASDSTTYGSGWTRDRAKEMGKPTEEIIIDIAVVTHG